MMLALSLCSPLLQRYFIESLALSGIKGRTNG